MPSGFLQVILTKETVAANERNETRRGRRRDFLVYYVENIYNMDKRLRRGIRWTSVCAGRRFVQMMKEILITLLGLMAAGMVLFAVIGAVRKEDIQIRTETGPIYNHFPDLPETSQMQWCSRSSRGIGLVTTWVYIFAFYDQDIGGELQDMEIRGESEEIELYFVPDGISGNEKWRMLENAEVAFQTGIKDTRKMGTIVYINEAGTILYIEAVGD